MYQSSSSSSLQPRYGSPSSSVPDDPDIFNAAGAVRSSLHHNRSAVGDHYYSEEAAAEEVPCGSLPLVSQLQISSPPGFFSHQQLPHHINAGSAGDLGVELESSSSSSWGNSNCISFANNSPLHETTKRRPAAPPTHHHHVDAANPAANFTTCTTHLETHQYLMSMSGTDWLQLHHNPHDQDSVPCKLRAKRGFATHPRSIAERERRIKISGKLKKLQELVPNMDKQSSYADMLDLAVDHIKGLQKEVQKLEKGLENCSCGSNIVR